MNRRSARLRASNNLGSVIVGLRSYTSACAMSGQRSWFRLSSTFALIVARQPSPVAQARSSRSMMVMDCRLLALANSLVRFEGWQLPT